MSNNILLNIILLTYNKLDCTKRCIESVYKYTKDFNLIIVDNESEEDMVFFLKKLDKKHKNLIVQYNKENVGIIKGRNQGYFLSQKKYIDTQFIFFLDSDQIVLPGWQESYYEFFEKGYEIIGKEAWLMRKDYYPYKRLRNKEDSEYFNYVGAGAMAIRNSVIKDVGLFDERYDKFYFEDPDFIFRADRAGHKIGWNYNSVIEHRKHNLSLFGERKIMFMKNWDRFKKKWNGHRVPKFKIK